MFYPGIIGRPSIIGKGKGLGYNINYGFDSQDETEMVSDLDYVYACETMLFPKIKEFQPEVILISCGFDSAKGDALGGLGITPLGYAWMTHGLTKIQPKIIALLEGGYDLDSLAVSSEAVIEALFISGDDSAGFKRLCQKLEGQYFSYEDMV